MILKKLEIFLSIFIFDSLGRKCATRGERQRKKTLIEANLDTLVGEGDLWRLGKSFIKGFYYRTALHYNHFNKEGRL